MQYDLYVHTSEYSSCSSLPADEICRLARLLGLRGIALTDHDTCWPEPELAALSARHTGQTIFNGTECFCREDHFLVFLPAAAMDRDRPPDVLTDLAAWVHRRCGFLFWVHPFRHGRKVSPAWLDELPIDGIEITSSNMDLQMGKAALSVAELYVLKTFVNSDAHREASLSCYGNDFEADITTMDQLIDNLNGDNLAGSKIGTGL